MQVIIIGKWKNELKNWLLIVNFMWKHTQNSAIYESPRVEWFGNSNQWFLIWPNQDYKFLSVIPISTVSTSGKNGELVLTIRTFSSHTARVNLLNLSKEESRRIELLKHYSNSLDVWWKMPSLTFRSVHLNTNGTRFGKFSSACRLPLTSNCQLVSANLISVSCFDVSERSRSSSTYTFEVNTFRSHA